MADEVVQIFLRAQDEATSKIRGLAATLNTIPGIAGHASSALGVIGLVGGAFAAAATAAFAASKAFSDTVEQLDNLSSKTGIAGANLQVYRRIIEDAGGNPEILTKPIETLNRAIATNDPLLAKLGVTTKDTNKAFLQLAKIFSESKDTAKVTEAAFRLLGKGGVELIGHFDALANSSADVMANMRQTGELIEGGPLKAARALDAQMDRLDQNWRGALNRMASATTPWVADMITGFNNLWDAISGNKVDTTSEIDRKMSEFQRDIEKAEAARDKARAASGGLFNAFDPSTDPREEIKFQERRIADLMRKTEELAKLRRQLTGANDKGRLQSIHGDEKPLLGPLDNLFGKESDRAKRIRELVERLGIGRNLAAAFADQLDRVEGMRRSTAELQKVFESLGGEGKVTDVGAGEVQPRGIPHPLQVPGVDPDSGFDLEKHRQQIREILDAAPKINAELYEIGRQFVENQRDITSAVGITRSAFDSLETGVNQAFGTIAANFGNKTQTIKSAWSTMVHIMEQEFFAFIAKIAAARVLAFIGGLIAGPGGVVAGEVAGSFASMAPSRGATGSRATSPSAVTNNVTMYVGYSMPDALGQLTSPNAAWRRAGERAEIIRMAGQD